jgi:azurin
LAASAQHVLSAPVQFWVLPRSEIVMANVNRRGFLKTAALFAGMGVGGAVLSACGGGGTSAGSGGAAAAQEVTLEIGSKGDELLFDKAELTAPAGAKVTLKFKNNASAASGNKHNWVLAKAGQADAIAADGIAAGEASNYLKAGDNRVIANTKLIEAGKEDTVTFTAPAAGSYDFICTFPGHNVAMKGKLVVQ